MDAMFWIMTVGGVLISVLVFAGVGFTLWRVLGGLHKTASEEARILQTGVPARAQIMQLQMGGMTVTTGVHRRLEVILVLQVQPTNQAPYPAQLKTLISELNIPQCQPGSWLQVRVDPMNPQKLAIEGFGMTPSPVGAPPGGHAPPMMQPQNAGYGGPQQAAGYGQPNMAFGNPVGGYPQPGAAYAAPPAPAGYQAQPAMIPGAAGGFIPAAPAAGFKLPLGAKIGIGLGALGLVGGLIAAIVAVVWTMGIGGSSDVCKKTAECCRKQSGNSAACDNYLKQTGPIANKVCEETLNAYRRSGTCK